jgi:glycosyltransferase involved in cell wall biosynthesis
MNPTRTAFVSLYTEMGGGEYGLFHLLEHLDRSAVDPVLLVNGRGPLTERVEALGIRVIVIPFEVLTLRAFFSGKSFVKNLQAARAIRRAIANEGITAVVASDVLTLLLLLPTLCSMPLRVFYNVIFFYEPVRRVLFNVLGLLFIDHIAVLSHAMRQDLLAGTVGLRSKVLVVHWGVDTARFRPRTIEERREIRRRAGLPERARLVALVGRYETWKGHLPYLDAVERLCGEAPDVCAMIIGGAMTGSIIPEVAAYHRRVQDRIESFTPRTSLVVLDHRDDIAELMASLDVVVCPSDREPYGLVVLESLACNVPVVVTSTVGALEVAQGKKGVFVAEAGSTQALYGQIKSAVSCSIGADDRSYSAKTVVEWPSWRDYSVLVEQKIGR